MTMFAQPTTPRLRREAPLAKLGSFDWSLLLLSVGLTGLGIAAIYSATHNEVGLGLAGKQVGFLIVGVLGMGMVASFDYRSWRDFLGVVYIVTGVALVLVLIIGREVAGTKGWFVIGGISLQPAEFAKLSLIVALAALFTGRAGAVDTNRLSTGLMVLGGVAFLVLLEGETGSVLVYSCIALGVFFVVGIPARLMMFLIISGIVLGGLIVSGGVLQDYQQGRLTAFVDSDSDPQGYSWNQRQSVTAVGSGGVTGAGYLEGPQTQFDFVPAQETDFIFTVIAEELGFVGAAVVLGLQALILVRILRAAQLARDGFGTVICIGVFTMLLTQVFQNVGMTLKLMPITGIPLPFVSYGGSSLLTSMLALGLVQSVNIYRHRGSPSE